jgi:hypothetical protein
LASKDDGHDCRDKIVKPRSFVGISTQLLLFMSLVWNGEPEIIAAGYIRTSVNKIRPSKIADMSRTAIAYRPQGNEGG